ASPPGCSTRWSVTGGGCSRPGRSGTAAGHSRSSRPSSRTIRSSSRRHSARRSITARRTSIAGFMTCCGSRSRSSSASWTPGSRSRVSSWSRFSAPQAVPRVGALDLQCGNDPALGIDVVRPAGDQRKPDVARRGQNADGSWGDDLVAGDPVRLRVAANRDLDEVTSLKVIQVGEDAALDVVMAVKDGVARTVRSGKEVVRHRVASSDLHLALPIRPAVVNRRVPNADTRDREEGGYRRRYAGGGSDGSGIRLWGLRRLSDGRGQS